MIKTDDLINVAFDQDTPAEVLSRVADQIRLRVPIDERPNLVGGFWTQVYSGYPRIPHMPGFEDTAKTDQAMYELHQKLYEGK